jgi:Zn-dependent protease with chaperone function
LKKENSAKSPPTFILPCSKIARKSAVFEGGFIFVTGPLLKLGEYDRNEIAFFLGHEIRHMTTKLKKEVTETLTSQPT